MGDVPHVCQTPAVSQNPINLIVRFLIEIAALVGLFRLGLDLGSGALGFAIAAGLVLAGAVAWGTFTVPGDRSRSGEAPVPVNGRIRLFVEAVVLGGAAIAWFVTGPQSIAVVYSSVALAHYLLSWDRLVWLIRVDSEGLPPMG
jgi:hypothetical protein